MQKTGLTMDINVGYQSPLSTCNPLGKLQRKTNLQESFIPSAEILGLHPSMKWSPAEITCQQNLVSGRGLPIDLSFLHPNCCGHVSSSSFPSVYENLPPWLVDAKIQGKASSVPFSLADVGGKYHPFTTAGTDFLATLNRPSVLSQHHSHTFQDSHVASSLGSSFFVQPPTFPFSHEMDSNSSMIMMSNGNRIKVADRMKFGVDNCQKMKKRPAAAIRSDMLRPTKMPNLIHENLSNVIELPRNDIRGNEASEKIGECELHFNWEERIEVQKDGVGTSNGIGLSEADGIHFKTHTWLVY
ncbi:hypothetical protein M5689_006776 [Euphorbia peplus]|nr:hypothetical protein M5689_006776 [Euphorbia peplus]